MDEYVCLTVLSRPGEAQSDFSSRLSRFWTHMLRSHPDDFEMVYAEKTAFDTEGSCLCRQYLTLPGVIELLECELRDAGIGFRPVDRDDLYSKYEAVAPDWMQIEH